MSQEVIITREAATVILSGLGWKMSEDGIEYEDRQAIAGFMEVVKHNFPDLAERYSYLYG